MKAHYDFTKAEQGKFYRPASQLMIPIYLDDDVRKKLIGKRNNSARNLSKLVNEILRSQIGVAEMLK